MAVALDAAVGSTASTWSHTNSAAGNAILVGVCSGTGSTDVVTAVSYGGVALTKLGHINSNGQSAGGSSLWGKVGGLPTGANTVSVTGFVNWAGSATYTGAGSLGTPATFAPSGTGTASSGSITVTGTTTGGMCAAVTSFGSSSTATATSPATKRWEELVNTSSAAGNGWFIDRASAGGGASTAVAWTDAAADWYGMVGVEILPSGGAALNGTLTTAATAAAAFGGTGPPRVSLVGSVGVGTRTTSGTTLTGAYGQTPTANNLLVAVIAYGGTTAATWSTAQHTGTTGWTHYASDVGNNAAGTSNAGVSVWYKTAAGGDAAPVFDVTIAGTEAGIVLIYELSGADPGSPFDTNGVYQSGGTSATLASQTATTSGNVSLANSFAFAVTCIERSTAASRTYANGGGSWVNDYSGDTATSSSVHLAADHLANPASGSPLTATFGWQSRNSSFEAAAVVVVKPAPVTDNGTLTAAATASASFGGTKTALPSLTASATAALSLTSGPPVITGVVGASGGNPGYFHDQYGQPRLVWGDAPWALCGNVGRWSSGAWQSDYDTYLTTRAGQGLTVIYTKPMGTVQSGNLNNNGGTFDNLYPFQGGTPSTGVAGANPSTGLTSAYWSRIDYFLNSAQAKGITVFLNAIGYDSDFDGGPGPLAGKSSTEFQAYGAALGARYKNQPNLVWHLADDYYGGVDSLISAFMTGVRGAGDTHAVSIENYPETTSRLTLDGTNTHTAWGYTNAQYNFVYSYEVIYYGVELAYTADGTVPVIAGDGYFYQNTNTYYAPYDRGFRQEAWWALSSGARGKVSGDEGIWQWPSTAQNQASTGWWWVNNSKHIVDTFTALTGWQNLIPDTSSALVTAGRGTHATYTTTSYEPATTDAYVTASRTSDGSLAVIYLSHATTITIDQTKLVSGYTAKRIDPVTGAATSVTTGSTYNSSTWGNNSQGDPDWVLVFQAPTTVTYNRTLTSSATAAATFGGTRTQFRSLTAAATAQASFRAVHPGHLTTSATAHTVFAGTRTQFRSLTAAATAQASFRAVHPGHLTTTATAQAAFTRTRTTFGSLTSSVTAGAAFSAVHPGHLTTTATAAAVFAGTVQGSNTGAFTSAVTAQAAFSAVHPGHFTPAATAQATFARTRVTLAGLTSGITAHAAFSGVHPGHLTAAATAQTAFTRTRIASAGLTSGITAQAFFSAIHPGHLTSSATAHAAFTGVKSGAGAAALTASVTAQALFKAVHPGHFAPAVTAQAIISTTRIQAGTLTASVKAQGSFSGTPARFRTFSSAVTARAQVSGTRTQFRSFTASARASAVLAGKKTGHGVLSSVITGQASFDVKRTLNGSLVSSVTAQMGAFGILPRLIPLNLSGIVRIVTYNGSAVTQYNRGTVKFSQDIRAVVTRPVVFGGTVSPVK